MVVEYLAAIEDDIDLDTLQESKCIQFKRMILEAIPPGGAIGVTLPMGYDEIAETEGWPLLQAFAMDDVEMGEVICLAYSTYTGAPIDTKSATKKLKEQLPNYSLPQLFKHFENIPITANGKTDYRTLKSAEKT